MVQCRSSGAAGRIHVCEISPIAVSTCVCLGESDPELEFIEEVTCARTDRDWGFCDLDAICEYACD